MGEQSSCIHRPGHVSDDVDIHQIRGEDTKKSEVSVEPVMEGKVFGGGVVSYRTSCVDDHQTIELAMHVFKDGMTINRYWYNMRNGVRRVGGAVVVVS